MQNWCKGPEKSKKSGTVQRKKCRVRKTLKNAPLVAKIGVDTAENEPRKGLGMDTLKAHDGYRRSRRKQRCATPGIRRAGAVRKNGYLEYPFFRTDFQNFCNKNCDNLSIFARMSMKYHHFDRTTVKIPDIL